jgi:hypothetical protein
MAIIEGASFMSGPGQDDAAGMKAMTGPARVDGSEGSFLTACTVSTNSVTAGT